MPKRSGYATTGPSDKRMRLINQPKPVFMQTERKSRNYSIPATNTDFRSIFLTRVDAGETDASLRAGRTMRTLRMEYMFDLNNNVPVRVLVVCPKRPGTSLSTATTPSSSVNTDIFWVVHDILWPARGGPGSGFWKHRFPKGLVSEFDTELGTTIQKNDLQIYFITNDQTVIRGHAKIWFTDH